MHPTDSQIDRFVRSDLPSGQRAGLEVHLLACASCTDRVRTQAREWSAIERGLRALDHQTPPAGADVVIRRARHRRRLTPRIAVAGLAAVVLAGAVLAMPAARLTRWLLHPSPVPERVTPPNTGAPEPPAPAPSGVAVLPGSSFELAFESAQPAGTIRVVVGAQDEVTVNDASGTVQYVVLPAGLRVRNRGSSASYEVHVPGSVQRLRIRVGAVIVFSKTGDSVVAARTADRDGAYVLPMSDSRR